MIQPSMISVFLVLFILAVAAAMLTANRAVLLPRSPLAAQVVAVVVAVAAYYLCLSVLGVPLLAVPPGLLPVAIFLGVLWVQPAPASRRGVCLSLAAAVGLVAVLAVFRADLLAAAAAAAACGYLSGLGREPGA